MMGERDQFIEDCRKEVKRLRSDLKAYVDGHRSTNERGPNGEWVDVSAVEMGHLRAQISTLESLIERYERSKK